MKNIGRWIAAFLGVAMMGVAATAASVASANSDAMVSPDPPSGFKSRTADLGGPKIHYVIGGSGPALLLVHGWPETWYEWRGVMPLLSKHYTVIAVDLRGMGDSSLEPSGYDKKTLAQDLFRLMSKLGYPRAFVVGHDWGGPVAYAYAAQHRDSVAKLAMIEGSPFGPWMKSTEPFWFFHFLRLPNGYAERLVTGREREFLDYFYNNSEMHVVPVFSKDVVGAYTRAYARPGRMEPSYGLYRTIDQDVRDNSGFAKTKLTMPVLAVGAEKGAGQMAVEGAQAVASNVTPLIFKNTGHFIPEERPQALAIAIDDFLAGRPVPPVWKPTEAFGSKR